MLKALLKSIQKHNVFIFQLAAITHLLSLLILQSDEFLDAFFHLPLFLVICLGIIRNYSFYILFGHVLIKGLYLFYKENNDYRIVQRINSHLFILSGLLLFFILSYIDKELEDKVLQLGQQIKENSPLPLKIFLFLFVFYKVIQAIRKDIMYSQARLTYDEIKKEIINFLAKTIFTIVGIFIFLKTLGHHTIAFHISYFMYDMITYTILIGIIILGMLFIKKIIPASIHKSLKWLVSK